MSSTWGEGLGLETAVGASGLCAQSVHHVSCDIGRKDLGLQLYRQHDAHEVCSLSISFLPAPASSFFHAPSFAPSGSATRLPSTAQ